MSSQAAKEWLSILPKFTESVRSVEEQVKALSGRVRDGELPTEKGMSLLELKQQLMLQYLADLSLLLETKVQGIPLASPHRQEGEEEEEEGPLAQQAIWDMAEIRVIMEKMKGSEQKSRYQIDKLVRAGLAAKDAEEGKVSSETLTVNTEDPYQFKPDPQALASKEEEEKEEEEKKDGKASSKKNRASDPTDTTPTNTDGVALYRAPRIAPVQWEEDGPKGKDRREARTEERRRQKTAQSRFMRDLVSELAEQPEEEDALGGIRAGYGGDDREQRRADEVMAWEEDNFIRRTVKKSERKRQEKMALSNFDNEFRNLNDLTATSIMKDVEDRDRKDHFSMRTRRQRTEEEQSASTSRKRKTMRGESREYNLGELFGEAGQGQEGGGRFQAERKKVRRQASYKGKGRGGGGSKRH
ncbi:MAG: hypothetical protein DHS80DRAFT_21070 [Piptocephalis tieghemiana]|nr:MAG: hypothetical protein DHS80DRAFT_21070 [Piptocephalis tieghemiana]